MASPQSPRSATRTRLPKRQAALSSEQAGLPTEQAGIEHLTEAQRAVVTHGDGPALVVAGAGTGKTRVLVERIAWLTKHRGVPAQNILALTFTEKAAAELESRVDLALPISAFRPWVGTFHGFGEYILREEAFAAGLDPRFRILSGPEAWLLLKRNLFALPLSRYRPLGNPTKFVQALVEFFSHAKDQGITPEMLETYAKATEQSDAERAAHWKELGEVYRAYVGLQRQQGVFDFGDLLLETIRIFRERPDVLKKIRARFTHILVDEFQDTNATQLLLLELLTGDTGNLLVASDDDQAIFAFRGSNVGNVLQFRQRFPNTSLLVLTDNFRSPQIILDAAYRLIQQNNPYRLEATEGITKRLLAAGSANATPAVSNAPAIEHRHFVTEEEEFAWIAEEILRLVDQGHAYRDIAVLARTNAQAGDFASSLLRRDIPHTVSESRGLLARPEVKDALAYFRLLGDPRDVRALFRLLSHPAFGIPSQDRAHILGELRHGPEAVLSFLRRSELQEHLATPGREGCMRIADILEYHLNNFRTLRPSAVYLEFLERSGMLKHAIQESDRHPEVLPNLQAFLAYVRMLEQGVTAADPLEFLELIDAAADSGQGPPAADLPPETDAVRLLTVHAAKGLEFPMVFVIGATADRYPARGRKRPLELPPELAPVSATLSELNDREAHVLEERRIFYVAITRARQRLVVTSSAAAAGLRARRKPSPFIAEAEIPSTPIAGKTTSPSEQLTLPLTSVSAPASPPSDRALTLSASRIGEYETCPLKYEFRYVLQVPTPAQHALSFGISMHAVLHRLGTATLSGQRPSADDALLWFDQEWIPEGYISPEHAAARKEAGRVALRSYVSAHPELLSAPPLAVEVPFSLQLATTRITGRIDRIDRADTNAVVITDFKTGEGKGKDAETDTQLSIYSLATRKALGLEPAKLRFSYVETGGEEASTRTPEQDQETIQHIEDIAAKIRRGEFGATPGYWCRFCDFRKICDYAEA